MCKPTFRRDLSFPREKSSNLLERCRGVQLSMSAHTVILTIWSRLTLISEKSKLKWASARFVSWVPEARAATILLGVAIQAEATEDCHPTLGSHILIEMLRYKSFNPQPCIAPSAVRFQVLVSAADITLLDRCNTSL